MMRPATIRPKVEVLAPWDLISSVDGGVEKGETHWTSSNESRGQGVHDHRWVSSMGQSMRSKTGTDKEGRRGKGKQQGARAGRGRGIGFR